MYNLFSAYGGEVTFWYLTMNWKPICNTLKRSITCELLGNENFPTFYKSTNVIGDCSYASPSSIGRVSTTHCPLSLKRLSKVVAERDYGCPRVCVIWVTLNIGECPPLWLCVSDEQARGTQQPLIWVVGRMSSAHVDLSTGDDWSKVSDCYVPIGNAFRYAANVSAYMGSVPWNMYRRPLGTSSGRKLPFIAFCVGVCHLK